MSGKEKKGNAFVNNPIVKAIGTQKLVVVLVIILLAAFFSIMSPQFRQYSTVVSICDFTYYVSFLAIGVTFCLITGGVDLSIGTGMICYGLFGGYLVTKMGMPIGVGILAIFVLALAFGALNGALVAIMDLPPFIATLGTMMIARGLGSVLTQNMSVAWPPAGSEQGWFRSIFKINQGEFLFPLGVIWVLLFAFIMSIFLFKTRPGRYIIAIGSNKEATRLSGVKVVKYHMLAYILSGLCTGLGALAYAAIFANIAPGTGAGIELDAIGGAIIGGTSMSGGYGTISGTILGVLVMALLKSGLPYIGLQANWQQIITGLVLIVAVMVDVRRSAKK